MRTMTKRACRRFRQLGNAGFSLPEMMIAAAVGLVVLGATFSLMTNQGRLYGVHRAEREVRQTLHASLAMLGWQIREATPAEGDLYAIGPNAISLRSVQGSAVVCATKWQNANLRLGLSGSTGYYEKSSADSAKIWAAGDQTWYSLRVNNAWNTTSTARNRVDQNCFWGDSSNAFPRPEAAIQIRGNGAPAGALAAISVGSPVRTFKRVEYGAYQDNGRWWLGRRVAGANTWERLSGPIRAPADSGLVFTYRNAAGNVTAQASQVASVEILLRAESESTPSRPGGTASGSGPQAVRDSLRTTVHLRNSS